MYNVLIADDEPAVCEGLSVLLDWEKYGFHVANTAEDGEDALEKLKNGRYNLLITDIRMPVLDGLGLIKAIKEQNLPVKILIISGYSDFNYAKKAIEYGVKGYLLKPVDREDFMEHIVKIKEELDNEIALHKGFLSGDNQILSYEYKKDSSENHIIEMNWDSSRLLEAIEIFDKKSIEAEINFYFDQIMNCQVTNGIMQAMLYNFVFAICTIIRKYNGDLTRIFSRNEIYELDNCKLLLRHMRKWLVLKCNETCDYIVELQKGKSSNIINQIKNYIDEKYSEDLSIKSIAGVFYLSPAYLGRLFKNSTGEGFSDYLNKIRISKVKKMILSEDSKVYEIINKVGYNNHEHFYRQFKRYVGISFAEYKENVRKS